MEPTGQGQARSLVHVSSDRTFLANARAGRRLPEQVGALLEKVPGGWFAFWGHWVLNKGVCSGVFWCVQPCTMLRSPRCVPPLLTTLRKDWGWE